MGGVAPALVARTALLVVDLDAVDLLAGALLEIANLPALDVARDVDALHLGVDSLASPARVLGQVVGEIHLVSAAFVLGLCRLVAMGFVPGHGSTPPFLVVVRLGADLLGPAVDLARGG